MELWRLRRRGTLPPPELFTADLEKEQEQLRTELHRQRVEGSSPPPVSTVEVELDELLEKLQKGRMEGNAMYGTIRSGLAKFDVSLPEELQSYVSYLSTNSTKLGLRWRVFQSPRALEELREAMDEDELKTFLTIHIREGAWQVVLLFMDELATRKLPLEWYSEVSNHEVWDEGEDEEMLSMPLYSSTSGILKAWPTQYDPGLVTLCKAITNRDCKVARLLFFRNRISDEGLKNLSTALTQSKLYSLTLYGIGLQNQGLQHLCEALISNYCNLTSLNVSDNALGDEIMHLCKVLTSVNCTLISLNVSHNRFGDEGKLRLRYALTIVNCTLTSLNVSGNQLGDKGMMLLSDALTSVNCKLTSLNVSGNRLGDKEVIHLCNALTSVNCTLTSLNVCLNWLGDEGIKHLCKTLTSVNCRLTTLNVRKNEFGDKGLKYLCDALTSSNCALTTLDICNNEFGDEGIKQLCKALTDTKCKLWSLDFHGNLNVTNEGEKYLSQMLSGTDWEVRSDHRLSRSTTKRTK